jgi:hypothetical protein
MSAPMSREEYLAVLLAPARRDPEPSRALPAAAYRDSAESVKLEAEKVRLPRKKPAPKGQQEMAMTCDNKFRATPLPFFHGCVNVRASSREQQHGFR